MGSNVGGGRELAGQQARRERHPGEDAHVPSRRLGEEPVRGPLAEHVEDDLDRGDARELDGLERLLDLLHADAVGGDGARGHQLVERREVLRAVVDGRVEAVELDQVQGLHAQVLAAAIRPCPERLGRVARHVQGRSPAHLGGDEEGLAGALGQEPADHPLAPPVAVDVRGVDEVHAGVGSRVEGAQAVRVVHRAPVRPDGPRPEPDDAHVAPGLAEPAVLHGVDLLLAGAGLQPIPTACRGAAAVPNGKGFRDLRPSVHPKRGVPICHNRDVAVSPGGPSPDGAPAPAARFRTRPDRGSAFVTRRTPSVDTPATARVRGFARPEGRDRVDGEDGAA